MAVTFRDKDGTTRLAGDLLIGGTTGDVATVQADGTVAPAPGGSQPCTVSEAEPADPAEGDLWLRILPNTDTYQLYAYNGSIWVQASAGVGAGATTGAPGEQGSRRVGGLVGDPDDDNFSGFETDTGWASSRMKSVDEDGNVNAYVEVRADTALMQYQSARLSADDTGWRLSGLPTIDPDVDGYLWVDPVTRILKVSDGP